MKILKPIITAPFLLELGEDEFSTFDGTPISDMNTNNNNLMIEGMNSRTKNRRNENNFALMRYPMVQTANEYYHRSLESTSGTLDMTASTAIKPLITPMLKSPPSFTIDPLSFIDIEAGGCKDDCNGRRFSLFL